MFRSISVAIPNSTVTSSFTASEACTVDFGETLTVRKNGQVEATRPVALAFNDSIEVSVVAPAANQTKYIKWFYNGNECYFAVVSNQGTTRPQMRSQYKNLQWYDYGNINRSVFYKSGSQEYSEGTNTWTNGTYNRDLVVSLSRGNNYVSYLGTNGQYDYSIFTEGSNRLNAVSYTWLWNSSQNRREMCFLFNNNQIGKVYWDRSQASSSRYYPGARTIFSDGTTLFVGGDQILYSLSDLNTIGVNYPTTETIIGGCGLGPTAIVATKSGKLLKLNNGTLTEVFSAEMLGVPAVFKNKFVIPVPLEYKLRILNMDLSFHSEIDMGDYMPFAGIAGRNNFTVSCHESRDIFVFTDLATAPTKVTFMRNITWACVQSPNIYYGDVALDAYDVLVPANPLVSGFAPNLRYTPIDVDAGSGDIQITSLAESSTASVAPNAKLLINSSAITTVKNNDFVTAIMRSSQGKRSTAIQLGHYAFDFVVQGIPSDAKATYVEILPKFMEPSVTFRVIVPPKTPFSYIALSHGNIQRNGAPYNGQSVVSEGDILDITLRPPANAPHFYSVLSIADSQYALVVNTATTFLSDTQRFQPYGSLTTKSTVVVKETGIYDFPNYTHGSVRKDGQLLTFPTTLNTDDTVEITHTKMSNWWLDERDTILLGPGTNYIVKGTTEVDDLPVDLDFGIVHDGIPDFSFPTDKTAVMDGLSDGYAIEIYHERMVFSVNGAEPVARPKVKNGDQIQAFYTVKNLFEEMFVKTNLLSGEVYEFGSVNIDPAKGEFNVPGVENLYMPTNWVEFEQEHSTGTQMSVPFRHIGHELGSNASIGEFAPTNRIAFTNASVGEWRPAPREAGTLQSVGEWRSAPREAGALQSVGDWQRASLEVKTPTSKSAWLSSPNRPNAKTSTLTVEPPRHTYNGVDISENYDPSRGHYVIFRAVEGYWLPLKDVALSYFTPACLYRGNLRDYSFSPTWAEMKRAPLYQFSRQWTTLVRPTFEKFSPDWRIAPRNLGTMFEPVWYSISDQRRVSVDIKTLYAYLHRHHDEYITSEPVFLGSKVPYLGVQNPSIGKTSTLVYGINEPSATRNNSFAAEGASGWHAADLQWDSVPTNPGGFETEEEAEEAGEEAARGLEVETYQQPEGTFSYIVKRETTLVCEIQPTGLVAKAWLLGGG
jgi:hypothetical protein